MIRRTIGRGRRANVILIATTVAALGLAACGSPNSSRSTATVGSNGLTSITVGSQPIMPSAAVRLGIQEGIYKKHGLDVRFEVSQSGSATMAAVVSGSYDIGMSSIVPQMQAFLGGQPIKVIAPASKVSGNAGVLVNADSGITAVGDLSGKRIAITNLEAIDQLSLSAAAKTAGIDPETLDWAVVPFPDMLNALKGERVDAIFAVEPFYSKGLRDGFRDIMTEPTGVVAGADAINAAYFTSQSYAAANSDIVTKFSAATVEANEFANTHPDELLKIIPTFTGLDEQAASKTIPTTYATSLDEKTWKIFADLLVTYAGAKETVDLSKLLQQNAN